MPDLYFDRGAALPVMRSRQLYSVPRLHHGFFTRLGGCSEGVYDSLNFRVHSMDIPENVQENYRRAAQSLGYDESRVYATVQTHSDRIAVVGRPDGMTAVDPPADALITNVPGVILSCFYADCQPVLIYDPHTRSVAAVHSGWRGVVNGIVPKTIAKMAAEFGARAGNLLVAVGPSICRSCFETDDDVPELMRAAHGESINEYIYREGGKWHIDLKNITYRLLLQAGVPPINIDISNACPCCGDRTLFWSHRRQGDDRGVHAAMIVMTE